MKSFKLKIVVISFALMSILITGCVISGYHGDAWNAGLNPDHSTESAKYAVAMTLSTKLYGDDIDDVTPEYLWDYIWLDGEQTAEDVAAELQTWGLTAYAITLYQGTILHRGDLVLSDDPINGSTWGTILSERAGWSTDITGYAGVYYNPRSGHREGGKIDSTYWYGKRAVRVY